MQRVVGVAVFASGDHDADFDGRVNGFHQRDVAARAHGVSVRIVRHGVAVGFPRAIFLVANLPILEAQRRRAADAEKIFAVIRAERSRRAQRRPRTRRVPVRAQRIHAERFGVGGAGVAIRHPCGGFVGGTGAVVHGDHRGDIRVGDDVDEIREACRPMPGECALPVFKPAIVVGIRAARKTQCARADAGELRQRRRRVEGVVPLRRVHAEPARVRRADGLRRVHREMRQGRSVDADELEVIEEKSRLRRAVGILDGEPGEICFVGHAERGQGNGVLLPGVGQRRGQMIARRLRGGRRAEVAIHLEQLPAVGAAMEPEADGAVGGIRHVQVIQLNAAVGAGDGRADGIGAGMNRRMVGETPCAITVILPAVEQRVGVDRQIGLCPGNR